MLNHITIQGRLTRDPELRRTGANNVAVTSFAIACDRDFGNNGEKETDFVEVVCWRNTAEFVSKYFSKGRMAIVSGRLQVRKWQNKDGENRYSTEVVADNVYFGDSKKEASSGESYGQQNGGYNAQTHTAPPASDFAMLDDDDAALPF